MVSERQEKFVHDLKICFLLTKVQETRNKLCFWYPENEPTDSSSNYTSRLSFKVPQHLLNGLTQTVVKTHRNLGENLLDKISKHTKRLNNKVLLTSSPPNFSISTYLATSLKNNSV